MNYVEYGKANAPAIMLLHGGGLSWWNYREPAERLARDHHVILPILDGHSGSDRGFTCVEDNAAEIIGFIDRELGGSVALLGGLSLGGQIALEMLSQRNDICRRALIESASVVPSELTRALIGPAFGSCYGLIKRVWFSKLQFRALGIKPALFEDYYRDTCGISRQDMIAFMKASASYSVKPGLAGCSARTYVYVGEREKRPMRRSAELIRDALPHSELRSLPGMRHGEFSINHPEDFARAVGGIAAGADGFYVG